MALVRCEDHPIENSKRDYQMRVKPLGYPNTAVICGRKDCLRPGMVWLDQDDVQSYRRGERIFPVPNAGIKVRVE